MITDGRSALFSIPSGGPMVGFGQLAQKKHKIINTYMYMLLPDGRNADLGVHHKEMTGEA